MNNIRICNAPVLTGDTDRWGRGLGTYSVLYNVGYVPVSFWEEIQAYQSYSVSTEGAAEKEAIAKLPSNQLLDKSHYPHMSKLLDRAKNMLIWQFNARVDEKPDDSDYGNSYIRMLAFWDNITIFEHEQRYDNEYQKLLIKAAELNEAK